MIRTITKSTTALSLSLLLLLNHAVFGLCQCSGDLFLGSCPCCEVPQEAEESAESTCCPSCSQCGVEETDDAPTPCDCPTTASFDFGDFPTSSPLTNPAPPTTSPEPELKQLRLIQAPSPAAILTVQAIPRPPPLRAHIGVYRL